MDDLHHRDGSELTQDLMAREGRRIVDAARERGLVLRLLGGLAVHEYCAGLVTCRREHSDLDMVALGRPTQALADLFEELGYAERFHVRLATGSGQAQFVRACVHGSEEDRPHDEDKVDVFFDSFRMDHKVDLRDRLEQDQYAIPLTDTLVSKLQMHTPEQRDVRDAIMLLVSSEGEGEGARRVDAGYVGELCAGDWGLFYDVSRNLQRCAEALDEAGLEPAQRARAAGLLARLTGAVDAAPKTLKWRLRARVGTRRQWWTTVEEQEGSTE